MLCRVGKISGQDIGSIKIQSDESIFEIASGVAGKFLESVGPDMKLEKNISLTCLDGPPDLARRDGGETRRPRKSCEKKSFARKSYKKKPYAKSREDPVKEGDTPRSKLAEKKPTGKVTDNSVQRDAFRASKTGAKSKP